MATKGFFFEKVYWKQGGIFCCPKKSSLDILLEAMHLPVRWQSGGTSRKRRTFFWWEMWQMPKQLTKSKRVVYLHEQPPLIPKLSAVVWEFGCLFFFPHTFPSKKWKMKQFNFTTDFYFIRNHDGRKIASERVGMKRVDLLAVGIYKRRGTIWSDI